MYKVFLNDTLVILTDSFELDGFRNHTLYVKYQFPEEIPEWTELARQSDSICTLIIQTADLPTCWEVFSQQFKLIEAAGGLVENGQGQFLMIHRNGMWDLPKGKIEAGENPEQAALREVEEECGLRDLKLGKALIDTYHTYPLKSREILKRTYWYAMQSGQTALSPQLEEGIDKVVWVDRVEAERLMKRSFANIRSVFGAYFSVVDDPKP